MRSGLRRGDVIPLVLLLSTWLLIVIIWLVNAIPRGRSRPLGSGDISSLGAKMVPAELESWHLEQGFSNRLPEQDFSLR